MDMNKWMAVGKVEAAPQISDNGGKKQASFNFIVVRRNQDASGQWTDVLMTVPMFAFDKKADLVEKYVIAGQELGVECHIMTWEANGTLSFGMIIDNVSFGFKPRQEGATQGNGGGGGFGGPPI